MSTNNAHKTNTSDGNTSRRKIVFGIIAVIVIAFLGWQFLENAKTDEDAQKSVKIGVILPLTGTIADVGKISYDGILMAQERINANGGINGKRLEIVVEDGGGDAKTAVNAYQKLLWRNNVLAVVTGGGVISVPISQYIKNAPKDSVAQIAAYTSAFNFSQTSFLAFRIFYDAKVEGNYLANFVLDNNYKKVAGYYSNNDYGRDIMNGIEDILKGKSSCHIVSSVSYELGQANHRATLEKIRAKQPDVCIFIGADTGLGIAVKQAKEAEITCQYIASSGMAVPGNFDNAREGAEGLFYTSTTQEIKPDKDTPIQKEFRAKYIKKLGKAPSYHPPIASAAMEIIAEAIRQEKSGDKKKIADEVYKIKNLDTSAGRLSATIYGDFFIELDMAKRINGRSVHVRE